MKRILLSLALVLLCAMGSFAANAYQNHLKAERGWSIVDNISSLNLSDYYFALVSSDNTDLMVKMDKAKAGQQESGFSMWYMNAKDPLKDNSYLWTLENNNTTGYVGYTIRNVDKPVRVIQTHDGNPQYARTNWEESSARWTSYAFNLNDGKYTIQALANGGTNYLGLWTPSNGYVSGQELAGNKSGNEIGKFLLYKISKATANSMIVAATDASVDTPYDLASNLFGRKATDYSGATGYYGDYVERYVDNVLPSMGDIVTKSVTGAPNGYHLITVIVNAAWISGRGVVGTVAPTTNDNSTVVTINGVSKNVPVRTDGSYNPVTLTFSTWVTDGTISFAIHNNDAAAFWFVWDITDVFYSDKVIANPSFESDFDGWTNTGNMSTQNNGAFGKTGSYYAEFWQPSGTKSVTQPLNDLPAGAYRLTARCKARGVSSARLYAGSVEQPIPIADVEDDYSVDFACDEDADVTIGFEAVGTGAGASWICVDNFRLTYLGSDLPDVEPVVGQMNASISSTQTTAIATYEADRTVANYNAASVAISAANASATDYAIGKAAIDKVDDILSKTNVYTTAAYSTFADALENARSAYNNGTWVDGEGAAYSNSVFGTEWRATATIDDFLISAWDVAPRTWDNYHVNTWSTVGDSGNPHLVVPSVEYWTNDNTSLSNKDMTATVAVEANKMYSVSAHITMAKNTTDYELDASTAPVGVSLQVGSGSATTCTGSRIEETRFFEGSFEATGRADSEGNLTIKISTSGTNASWILFRDVKYTKLTEVTMKTFAPATYGTFIAPFDVAIPSGVTVSKVTGLDGNRLILDDISTTIPKNTPVVVYSDASINETFNGKDESNGETSYSVGLLTGVYTNATVAAGNYVLQTQGGVQGFYQVVGDGLTAVPYRAYLNSEASSKAFKAFFFGDDAVGINKIQDSGIKNLDSEVYNLAGQRLSKARKGVNIINGKKVLIK